MALLKVLMTLVALTTTVPLFCLSADSGFHRRRRGTLHPHTHLSTPGIIRSRGYPAEIHSVVTKDGYVLEVHRIPYSPRLSHHHHHRQDEFHPTHPESSHQNAVKRSLDLHSRNHTIEHLPNNVLVHREKKVVFIQHCVLCSSADFVMNDPKEALAFIFSDAGYDVWLGNYRGNIYSRRHVSLSPKTPKFWDFSWDTMAQYDLPAMLGYVKSATGVGQLSYVGHSMGTTTFFAMMNYHPHINSWIRVMAAMAPVAYMHNKHAPFRVFTPVINNIDRSLSRRGRLEFMTPTRNSASLYSGACSPKSILRPLCNFFVDLVGGPSTKNVDQNYLSVITSHTPAGSSFHVLTHFLQLVQARQFQAFDYGAARNYREYGSPTPPPFSLAAVTVPVGAFWSDNDWVADPTDVHQTLRELPQLVLSHRVQHNDFNHLDFLWAENAAHLVYRHVIALVNRYN